MSTPADYTTVTQVYAPKWFPSLNAAINGWNVQVRDNVTGTILTVFVDEDHYTVDNVRAAVENALAPIREVAALGRKPPASASG